MGRLIPAGTGLAFHEGRRKRREDTTLEGFVAMSESENESEESTAIELGGKAKVDSEVSGASA